MIRAKKLSLVHAKRTCLPLYGYSQATPYAAFLDSELVAGGTDEDFVVYPGMVAVRTTGEQVGVPAASADFPFGLFANFVNGDLDEVGDSTEVGVWRGGPDATFEILNDALDPGTTWSTAEGALLYGIHTGDDRGKLTTDSDTDARYPVGRVIEVVSSTAGQVKIVMSLHLEGQPGDS